MFAKTRMFAYRAFVWLTALVCLHTDDRKLSQAARGHHPYPLHYVSKVGAVFALRFFVEKIA